MSNSPIPAERWRGIFREHRASGLSVAAFCRRAGISPAPFYSWRRKLRHEPTRPNRSGSRRGEVKPYRGSHGPADSKVSDFVEVQRPAEAMAEASALELRLPGGRSLVIRPGFDRPTLRALLTTLESWSTFGDRPEMGA